ncbi:MAG: hypothetical protein F6K16_41005 [Symploca sp. SIO2B6]|nr:hypothetical protein [Symploca sp. SIO2B6]
MARAMLASFSLGTLTTELIVWVQRLRPPTSTSSSHFDPSRWDHYLLVICVVVVSSWTLWLSWRWQHEEKQTSNEKGNRSSADFLEQTGKTPAKK